MTLERKKVLLYRFYCLYLWEEAASELSGSRYVLNVLMAGCEHPHDRSLSFYTLQDVVANVVLFWVSAVCSG